jgi:hypothetical protein
VIPPPDPGGDAAGAETALSHRLDTPRLRSPEAPTAPIRCRAVKTDGTRCEQVVPEEGNACLWHDDARAGEAQAARARGAEGKAAAARAAKYRTVTADAVPHGRAPRTMDDAIAWSSWLTLATVTGQLDPTTVREANRSLQTLKDSLTKRDLLARIGELEKLVKRYERERGRRHE